MGDVIRFPGKDDPDYDMLDAFKADMDSGNVRTFVALAFETDNHTTTAYLPDEVALSDLLMGRAILDEYIFKLMAACRPPAMKPPKGAA